MRLISSKESTERFKGMIDFGIITMRDDETKAVAKRFPKIWLTAGNRGQYTISSIALDPPERGTLFVAHVQTAAPGHGEAQRSATNLIEDLDPSCLVLVGIGGAVPEYEFSLGDVVVAKRIHDFSVSAWLPDGRTETAAGGGPMHPIIENAVGVIQQILDDLGPWNTPENIGRDMPSVPLDGDRFVGPKDWAAKVKTRLQWRFFDEEADRLPTVVGASIASGDVLVKDPRRFGEWLEHARDLKAVEMELPGVYQAARRAKGDCPILAIRGISDVVGYKRDPAWTAFACDVAASFTRAFLTACVVDLPVCDKTGAPKPPGTGTVERAGDAAAVAAVIRLKNRDDRLRALKRSLADVLLGSEAAVAALNQAGPEPVIALDAGSRTAKVDPLLQLPFETALGRLRSAKAVLEEGEDEGALRALRSAARRLVPYLYVASVELEGMLERWERCAGGTLLPLPAGVDSFAEIVAAGFDHRPLAFAGAISRLDHWPPGIQSLGRPASGGATSTLEQDVRHDLWDKVGPPPFDPPTGDPSEADDQDRKVDDAINRQLQAWARLQGVRFYLVAPLTGVPPAEYAHHQRRYETIAERYPALAVITLDASLFGTHQDLFNELREVLSGDVEP